MGWDAGPTPHHGRHGHGAERRDVRAVRARPGGAGPYQGTADGKVPAINALPIPWVEPADISSAMLWLGSDESRYVTGVTLPVDAGSVLL